jgi:hypothetical protein
MGRPAGAEANDGTSRRGGYRFDLPPAGAGSLNATT